MHTIDELDRARRRVLRSGFRALNRVVLPAVRAGVGSPLPIGAGLVVLETTGRVSGLPRQVPLVATRLGSQVRVSSVRASSQWVRNALADPQVSVWVGGRRRSGTATVRRGSLQLATVRLGPPTDGDGASGRGGTRTPDSLDVNQVL